jgi:hypothetical protein
MSILVLASTIVAGSYCPKEAWGGATLNINRLKPYLAPQAYNLMCFAFLCGLLLMLSGILLFPKSLTYLPIFFSGGWVAFESVSVVILLCVQTEKNDI